MNSDETNCVLCDVLNHSPEVPWAAVLGKHRLRDQFLTDGRRVAVLVDVAPTVPGHILIVPKAHIPSIAHCDSEELAEVESLRMMLEGEFRKNFPDRVPVWFEHGECRDGADLGASGCRVFHAHLHGVPADPRVFERLERDYVFNTVQNLAELRSKVGDRSYLFIHPSGSSPKYCLVEQPEGQLLRRMVCEAHGCPDDWNWRDQTDFYTEAAKIRLEASLRKLRPSFETAETAPHEQRA